MSWKNALARFPGNALGRTSGKGGSFGAVIKRLLAPLSHTDVPFANDTTASGYSARSQRSTQSERYYQTLVHEAIL